MQKTTLVRPGTHTLCSKQAIENTVTATTPNPLAHVMIFFLCLYRLHAHIHT